MPARCRPEGCTAVSARTDEFWPPHRSNCSNGLTSPSGAPPMSRMIFVNLPVKDLERSVAFWKGLGFEFNPQFTDDRAACLIVSDHACVMLLTESFFSEFTNKQVADATRQTEAIVAL